ncbi:MAG: hypothetical protein ACP5D6_06440, partial [Kosmotogaceae bacterium]
MVNKMKKPKTKLTFQAEDKYFASRELVSITLNVEEETLIIKDIDGIETRVIKLDLSDIEEYEVYLGRKW